MSIWRLATAAALLLAVVVPAQAQARWIAGWASAQMIPEGENALEPRLLNDATLRQVVRVTVGGRAVRVLLSNSFGNAPLTVGAAHLAPAAPGGAIVAGGQPILFAGRPSVTIPAGAQMLSDPVAMPVQALSSLAVSLHLPDPPARQTGHPGARATSYLASGNHVAAARLPDARTITRWYQLAALLVDAGPNARAVVTLGDSITDGYGTTTDGNGRWPDRLAERLQSRPALRDVAVLNMGIGGNRLLRDGLGPSALARLERDVLAQPGAAYLILLQGVNDLGTLTRDAPASAEAHAALVAGLIGGFGQIVDRAHAHGIQVIGATIPPYGASAYYHPGPASEADRQAINRWIRTSGRFDAVVDLDALMRDPADPTRLLARFDSGDGLHPSAEGYRAIADAIPLALFERRPPR
ncbi:lysophospholipase L1-like esterase [Sphingomonas jejuensis]|uniref:Lysophospholipase L1-like esterase n=1 Tax=Sphingomonas jejuensis TaxID=904715 RepID=A0ABX0XMY3_9SPHN|nr:SGNH/GDSL hydrolase family protein [Sphingomonas jejuensis]NJC34149.1 lysophospholipase L1-like esterase [Sphingomonas jejuensis]